MYINADTVIRAAALLAAVSALVGAIISVYQIVARDRRQSKVIEDMQSELTVICYGLRGALQGLIESGCNGPCREALASLDKHLNHSAHKPEL